MQAVIIIACIFLLSRLKKLHNLYIAFECKITDMNLCRKDFFTKVINIFAKGLNALKFNYLSNSRRLLSFVFVRFCFFCPFYQHDY